MNNQRQLKLTAALAGLLLIAGGRQGAAGYCFKADAQAAPEVEGATLTTAEDSVAAAFSAIMAEQIGREARDAFPDDSTAMAEAARGIADALQIAEAQTPYALGFSAGLSMLRRIDGMRQMGYPLPTPQLVGAMSAALTDSIPPFTVEGADAYLRDYLARLSPTLAPVSQESQREFLASQQAREGVETLPSGLLFEVLTQGEGQSPTEGDTVTVTYTGRLADGTVFDEALRPTQLPVAALVPGFSEGLKLMKPGGTYRLFLPASLAYGQKGAPGAIPPNSALDFTVSLLEIVPR